MIKFKEAQEFGDSLARFFPDPNNKLVKTITFQITDDCNLCCSYCYQINKGHHKCLLKLLKNLLISY